MFRLAEPTVKHWWHAVNTLSYECTRIYKNKVAHIACCCGFMQLASKTKCVNINRKWLNYYKIMKIADAETFVGYPSPSITLSAVQ